MHISRTALPLKIIPESNPTKVSGTGSILKGNLGGLCRLHQFLSHVFGNTQALSQTLMLHAFSQTVTQIWSVSMFCPNTSQMS